MRYAVYTSNKTEKSCCGTKIADVFVSAACANCLFLQPVQIFVLQIFVVCSMCEKLFFCSMKNLFSAACAKKICKTNLQQEELADEQTNSGRTDRRTDG